MPSDERRADEEIRQSHDRPQPTPIPTQARNDPPGNDPATADNPLTGGRVDAAAATVGSLGTTAAGDPISNVGGAQGSQPDDSVADQPIGTDEARERAGYTRRR